MHGDSSLEPAENKKATRAFVGDSCLLQPSWLCITVLIVAQKTGEFKIYAIFVLPAICLNELFYPYSCKKYHESMGEVLKEGLPVLPGESARTRTHLLAS